MALSDTTGSLMRGLGLADPVIRLGVTGLSRAGKTVFITSLVANLLDRGRMPALRAAADGSIRAAWLQPQPDDTVPRFEFERHLAALTGPDAEAEMRLTRLAGGDLRRDAAALMDEIKAVGFFPGPRVVLIEDANDAAAPAIAAALDA